MEQDESQRQSLGVSQCNPKQVSQAVASDENHHGHYLLLPVFFCMVGCYGPKLE